MNKVKAIIILLSLISFSGILFYGFSSIDTETEVDEQTISFNPKYSIIPVSIPKNLVFADEVVPVNNFDTYESLDREILVNTYWQSQTLMFIKRANRFFPVIEPILKENGVPDDFKYLAVAESGLLNVVSPSKAAGFWQFLKGTADDYKLEVNDEVDERYHLEKSTEAFCKYMLDAYQHFDNWTLAAAAYNMGIGGVNNQLKRQKVSSYYGGNVDKLRRFHRSAQRTD